MKHILIILLAFPFFCSAQDSTAVTTQNVQWNAARFTDIISNVAVEKSCQFVSHGTTSIDWIQKGGALVYSLSISNVSGTWNNIGQDGSISYTVQLDDLNGTVAISRSDSVIHLTLTLHGGTNEISNTYEISDFKIL